MNEVTFEDFPKNQKEFAECFSNEQACHEYLFRMRWPQGFRYPRCGHPCYCGKLPDGLALVAEAAQLHDPSGTREALRPCGGR